MVTFAKAFSSRNIIYIKNKAESTVTSDKYDQLNKLNNLRSSGTINNEEFEAEKKKILDL
ncbi:SHOCT domain-containing protein [Chryseobacterium sp. MEBOG07]|uniref:SHOCT domain-containing protein n=1 Tax=Chryseobacterium sp. MEBOG07 TaxID=2879939 RepID=UPI00397B9E82|nr:SHOCT domain-containing protein [Chryseobacterium sp. MEBOG07]